jgi:CRISPR-associated protein Cmr4
MKGDKTMTYRFFQLNTRSYTHVGQGAADTGVIDNLIQREKPYNIPVMHSSSLKGAFRSHCKDVLGYSQDDLNLLFGLGETENGGGSSGTDKKMYQSIINFHDARLLFLPVGALYEKATYHATSVNTLNRYYTMINKLLQKNENHALDPVAYGDIFNCFHTNPPQVKPFIEGFQGKFVQKDAAFLQAQHFGIQNSDIALFEEERFRDICEYCIPVIERNKLDDGGISENKFNEEVLPYDACFWFFLSYPDDIEQSIRNRIDNFVAKIQETYVQIGANYSLSQGLCEIKELSV